MISSLIDTSPLPSQSPAHDTAVALGVALADGAGVPVGVALEAGVLLGNDVAVPLTVGVAVAVRSTVGVGLAGPVEVTVAVALAGAVRVLVGDEEPAVTDGLGVRVAVAELVTVAVRVTVAVALRVGVGLALRVAVGVEELVGVALDVEIRVGVRVAVEVGIATVALGVGVGVSNENGAENSEVLLLMSVLVAVTCGPLSGPLKVQLPSVVKTEPSKTRPSSSESEKISTVQLAHDVPCSGPTPSIIGNPRSSLASPRRRIPASPLA
jgi:hypothetical protein